MFILQINSLQIPGRYEDRPKPIDVGDVRLAISPPSWSGLFTRVEKRRRA
jgi:hypothetical protein